MLEAFIDNMLNRSWKRHTQIARETKKSCCLSYDKLYENIVISK